jgi:hypothetical protein
VRLFGRVFRNRNEEYIVTVMVMLLMLIIMSAVRYLLDSGQSTKMIKKLIGSARRLRILW